MKASGLLGILGLVSSILPTPTHDLARAAATQTRARPSHTGRDKSARRCTWGPNSWKRPGHIPAP